MTNKISSKISHYPETVFGTSSKITLEHGKTYITAGGERVTVKAQTDSFTDFYKFKGDNNYRYGLNGDFHPLCYGADNKHIIVSEYKEPQVQPKIYTAKETRDLAEQSYLNGFNSGYDAGLSVGNTFTTSELQSLTKMQSKVITTLEAEILELKVTAAYLGNCTGLVNRVNGLRKQIFNEITTKKKRLAKLVALQQRMKRSK